MTAVARGIDKTTNAVQLDGFVWEKCNFTKKCFLKVQLYLCIYLFLYLSVYFFILLFFTDEYFFKVLV